MGEIFLNQRYCSLSSFLLRLTSAIQLSNRSNFQSDCTNSNKDSEDYSDALTASPFHSFPAIDHTVFFSQGQPAFEFLH